jgi:hypothetical protein
MLFFSTRWRAGLTALLLLALPVQGYAVASMLVCGMGGLHVMGSMTHAGHTDHQPTPQALVDAHAGHSATEAPHSGLHAQHQSPTDASQASGDAACSACAACFVGAALPVAEHPLVVHGEPQGFAPSIMAAVQPARLDGLERPPRNSLD